MMKNEPNKAFSLEGETALITGGGTGLGLSIVKHIIQAHGGEVKLETTLGKGTIFRLTLPIAEEIVDIPDRD